MAARIVEFFQVPCEACTVMQPVIDQVNARCAVVGAAIERVNARMGDGVALAAKYGVTGTPTIVVLDAGGILLRKLSGIHTFEEVLSAIEKAIGVPCAAPSGGGGGTIVSHPTYTLRPEFATPSGLVPGDAGGSECGPEGCPLPGPGTGGSDILTPFLTLPGLATGRTLRPTAAPPYTPPYTPPATPTAPPASSTPTKVPMARIIEITQATCVHCMEAAPAVAQVNSECGGSIEQFDGVSAQGNAVAARFGVSTTPTFLFLDDTLTREIGARIANVPSYAQLKAAVQAVGRCSPAASPTPSAPAGGGGGGGGGSTPAGGIPGGGSAPAPAPAATPTSTDVAGMTQAMKVRVLTALAFQTSKAAIYALANEVATAGFGRAANRLRAVAGVL